MARTTRSASSTSTRWETCSTAFNGPKVSCQRRTAADSWKHSASPAYPPPEETVRTVVICTDILCNAEVMPGSDRCRRHTPAARIRELLNGTNGHHEDATVEALGRMDAGEPQQPATRPRGAAWTDDEILNAIRRWNIVHGEPPTANAFRNAHDGYPSLSVVTGHFGSWADAIEKAGFPRPQRGTASHRKRAGQEPLAGEPATGQPTGSSDQPTAVIAVHEPVTPPERTPEAASSPADPLPFSLALTGDFHRDANTVRQEASKLRRQAEALDVIATGIEQLATA